MEYFLRYDAHWNDTKKLPPNKNIRMFYGDSDNDITAARDVGIRGIRILRASNSTYKPLPQAGAFGEEVIVNSEY